MLNTESNHVDVSAFVLAAKQRIAQVGADQALTEMFGAAMTGTLSNAEAARRDERAFLLRVVEEELGKRAARHLALALKEGGLAGD